MTALDRLAQHDEWMRGHYRAVARALVPDLALIELEAAYRELPESDRHAITLASQAVQRIANDES